MRRNDSVEPLLSTNDASIYNTYNSDAKSAFVYSCSISVGFHCAFLAKLFDLLFSQVTETSLLYTGEPVNWVFGT